MRSMVGKPRRGKAHAHRHAHAHARIKNLGMDPESEPPLLMARPNAPQDAPLCPLLSSLQILNRLGGDIL